MLNGSTTINNEIADGVGTNYGPAVMIQLSSQFGDQPKKPGETVVVTVPRREYAADDPNYYMNSLKSSDATNMWETYYYTHNDLQYMDIGDKVYSNLPFNLDKMLEDINNIKPVKSFSDEYGRRHDLYSKADVEKALGYVNMIATAMGLGLNAFSKTPTGIAFFATPIGGAIGAGALTGGAALAFYNGYIQTIPDDAMIEYIIGSKRYPPGDLTRPGAMDGL